MRRLSLLLPLLFASSLHAESLITWKRQQLHGDFYSEGAGIGDINGDGKPDIVAGPFWWEGPSFEKKHAYYEPKVFSINGYSDNFFAYVHDFNRDQKNDILILGFPGKEARLYLNVARHSDVETAGPARNPAVESQAAEYWPMHIVADVVDNESPVFTDITGDGKPEIVCSTGGRFGWFAPNWDKPTEKWPFVAVTPDVKVAKFTHGMGVGDVNGDGKLDLLEAKRWWEAPAAPEISNSKSQISNWIEHTFAMGLGGGAQMFAYDFDGNGTNDIFTSLAAHRYGVAVFLQRQGSAGTPARNKGPNTQQPQAATEDADKIVGAPQGSAGTPARNKVQNTPQPQVPTNPAGAPLATWNRTMLASENPADNDYGIVFSQPHAAHLADINGDGVMDIVTGKRYWAHNGNDPDERGARVLYWYETKRDGKGGVDFVPHLVDANSGVGVDVQVGDVNGDKLPDIIVANKAGVYVLTQQRKEVSAEIAEQMRPKKLYGDALKPQKFYANGLPAQDALKAMQLPGGFKADLIAAEPDIVQPIAMCWDERGRLWVVEGMSYPKPREPGAGQDRIKILEDKDGDGSFETVKVFCDGISLASGIQVGFGGVWVGAAPYFMFIPDADRDDKPDASHEDYKEKPKVQGLNFTSYALLDGWGAQDTHETLNSFIWGPDGWLYGCHGVFTHSKVGQPGMPDDMRTPLNAGVWRYHPIRHTFEVFAHGTSNPWGLDYDQNGEFFLTACVIPHLYHIVPGGRYHRQGGPHFNPHTYEDMQTIANHAHYAGDIRSNAHWGGRDAGAIVQDDTNGAGGGHAHCGLAIYQSSLFPQNYRNTLIFGNLHGHRLVTDHIDVIKGALVGRHGSDFMRSNDMNFVPVTQIVGPDGALYVSDWSDKQVCHRGSNAVELWDRSNGRIYRVSYAGWKPWKGDLAKEDSLALIKLSVQTENEWLARTARRVLMERHGKPSENNLATSIQNSFESIIVSKTSTHVQKLRALWGMRMVSQTNRMDVHFLADLIEADPALAPWAIRLLGPVAPPAPNVHEFADPYGRWIALLDDLTKGPALPGTIRELASLMQSMPLDQRSVLARGLVGRDECKDDPQIPLLIWYGIEPLVAASSEEGLELARLSKLPKVTEFIYRRMAAEEAGRSGLLTLASQTKDDTQRETLVRSVLNAARGGHKLDMPPEWQTIRAKLGDATMELEAYMDEPAAKQKFRDRLADASQLAIQREAALNLLLTIRDSATSKILHDIIRSGDKALLRRAVQGLGTLYHPESSSLLLEKFPSFDATTQNDAINALATNSEGAKALLMAVKAKTVPNTMLSPFLARQLDALKDTEVSALLKETFGDINAPKPDLEQRKRKFRPLLKAADLAEADVEKGRMIYTAICGQCHKLFGEGQNVGPDLTGSNRANVDYLLDNILDPNAVIGKDYQLNIFELGDGRVASGVIKEESPAGYRIAMPGGLEQTVTAAEIKKRTVSKMSTMPEGLIDALPAEQLQQLVAYLQTNAVPTKPTASGSSGLARKVEGALEGETLKILETKGGRAKVQGMAGFGGRWSNGAQMWWTGGKPGDTLTIAVPVEKSGKYALKAVLTKARDYGMIEVALDGKPIEGGKSDLFNTPSVIITDELDWGVHELTAGEHKLTVKITGANPAAAKSFMFGLDYLRLEPK
jgi:putative membrane-bound dehydrogenase-like protein